MYKAMNDDALIEQLFDTGYFSGLSTGFSELDRISGGLKKGQLVILAGSTGMGKSILGLSILTRIAKSGIPTCYFDLENGKEESYKRILKTWYGLRSDFFLDEKNKSATQVMLQEVENTLDYWGLEDLYSFGYQAEGWRALEKIIRNGGRSREYKPRVVVIDPLQALETSDDPGKSLLEQGNITKHFKELAQKLGITIIICHHLRKTQYTGGDYVTSLDDVSQVKYRIPTVEDLKGSSKIGDFAQGIWGLVRIKDSTNKTERSRGLLRELKNRNGLSGDIKLFFNEDTLSFSDRPLVENEMFNSVLLPGNF